MQTQLSSHPTQSQLAEFAAGKLADLQVEAVAKHLDACAACSKIVLALPPDTMTGRVQAAQPGFQPVPAESWAGGSPSLLGAIPLPDGADVPLQVPAELANHPKFRIVGELGRGGMGVVYKAEHRIMLRPVAIKVINKSFLENAEALQRFNVEVRTAARLNHPHIVQAFDAEQAGELHFLVMEFVEGKSLAEILEKRQKPLPIQHACAYVRQAALGLQHAHEQQMVHRDIKPHNLMLTPKGQIKILDFGLARMVRERSTGTGLTAADSFMGTPEYVAPEQAADARNADIRADLYSLGCTLYFLLAARPPFRESTAMKVVLAHLQDVPKPLPELREDIPAELWAIVMKLLAKDPAGRYQTPTELVQALTPLAKSGSAAPPLLNPDKEEALSSPGRATVTATETSEINKSKLGQKPFRSKADESAQDAIKGRSAKRAQAKEKDSWGRWPLIAVGLAALALVIGTAAIIIRLQTKDGIIVLQNLPDEAVVEVDGGTVTLKAADGKPIEVRIAPNKKHLLEIKKNGFVAFTKEIEIDAGWREPVLVQLKPITEEKQVAADPPLNGGPGKEKADQSKVAEDRKAKVNSPTERAAADSSAKGITPTTPSPPPVAASPGATKNIPAKTGEWLQLFNGKDLTGWNMLPAGKSPWTVENGILTYRGLGTKSYLESQLPYNNFHLRIETLKTDVPGGWLRFGSADAPDGGKNCFYTWLARLDPKISAIVAGSLMFKGKYLQSGAGHPNLAREDSFQQEVIVERNHIYVMINGMNDIDHVIETEKTYAWPIAFMCDPKSLVRIRKIEIKELPPPENAQDYVKLVTAPAQIMKGHVGRLTDVAFAPDGKSLTTSSDSVNATTVETDDGRANITKPGDDNSVRFWDLKSGQQQFAFTRDLGQKLQWQIQGFTFSPDKNLIAISSGRPGTASGEPTVTVWDLHERKRLHVFALPGREGVKPPWFSQDGKTLFVCRFSGNVHVFNLNAGKEEKQLQLQRIPGSGNVRGLCTTRDRKLIFGGTPQGSVGIWSADNGLLLRELKGHKLGVLSLELSPDEKFLVSASRDGTSRVWNLATYQTTVCFQNYGAPILAAAFVPGSSRVVTGAANKVASLWDISTGKQLAQFIGHDGRVACLAVSSDGRFLATGSDDGTARLWNIPESHSPRLGMGTLPNQQAPPAAPIKPAGMAKSGASLPETQTIKLANDVDMMFKLIPKGKFHMGSPSDELGRNSDDEQQHEVEITKPFYMAIYPVTQAQYEALTGKNPSWNSASGGNKNQVTGRNTKDFPVERVRWSEARAFCAKMTRNDKLRRTFRLPTEAEWEYACRAGTPTSFNFGNVLNGEQANCDGRKPYGIEMKGPWLGRTEVVGSYAPNAWGIYDMHGNVLQWCEDWYGAYEGLPTRDPLQTKQDQQNRHVVRGGSYMNAAQDCRAARRLGQPDTGAPGGGVPAGNRVGFRVAFSID